MARAPITEPVASQLMSDQTLPVGPEGSAATRTRGELPGRHTTSVDGRIEAEGSLIGDTNRVLINVTIGLAIIASLFTFVSLQNSPRLSAFDEATHIDYSLRASRFELTHTGQEFDDYTLQSWSCRGQAGIQLPPCGIDSPNRAYPAGATQYNAFHPPLYYFVTGLSARVISGVTGIDFVLAGRALGAVWLWSGMFALYCALRYWRVERGYAFAAALALPLVPMILHASSTVTNDAAAVLCGAAALYVLGRVVVHDRTGWLVPSVVTLLAAATKVMNALPLAVVGVVFLLMAIGRFRSSGWQAALPLVKAGMAMIGVIAVVHFGWTTMQNARAVPNWVNPVGNVNAKPIEGLPFDEWAPAITSGPSLINRYYLDPQVSNSFVLAWATALNTLVTAAPLVAMAVFKRNSIRWIAGGTALLGVFSYPIVVQLMAALNGYKYFPLVASRYGMSVVPLLIAAAAMVLAHKNLKRFTTGMVLVGTLVVLATAAGILTTY